MSKECPICESGNVAYTPYRRTNEQQLIDLLFECVIVSTKYNQGKSIEQVAEWTAKQLRDNGFDTQPMGASWGVLKK